MSDKKIECRRFDTLNELIFSLQSFITDFDLNADHVRFNNGFNMAVRFEMTLISVDLADPKFRYTITLGPAQGADAG